jgi:predicted acetyltransferase
VDNSVELERGKPHQKPALDQLIQFYVHDFSDFWRPEQRVDLGEDGKFPPFPHLDEYWTDPTRTVYFIRANGALAGFALLNKHSHVGDAVDVNVGEYFIARPYRRGGAGAQALKLLIDAHAGEWEVAISQNNLPAQSFWPRAIANAGIAKVTRLEGDGERWTGPVLRFRAGSI